jgi:predicted transcriptional regulator
MEQEHLSKTHQDLCNRELTITSQEGIVERRAITLTSKGKELADKEKRLVEIEL